MGQSLPDQQEYNFKGVLDEFKIFDFAVSPEGAKSLFETGIISKINETAENLKISVRPNPTSDKISIELEDKAQVDEVIIYNLLGEKLGRYSFLSSD